MFASANFAVCLPEDLMFAWRCPPIYQNRRRWLAQWRNRPRRRCIRTEWRDQTGLAGAFRIPASPFSISLFMQIAAPAQLQVLSRWAFRQPRLIRRRRRAYVRSSIRSRGPGCRGRGRVEARLDPAGGCGGYRDLHGADQHRRQDVEHDRDGAKRA
jgi:hypothetical protein